VIDHCRYRASGDRQRPVRAYRGGCCNVQLRASREAIDPRQRFPWDEPNPSSTIGDEEPGGVALREGSRGRGRPM